MSKQHEESPQSSQPVHVPTRRRARTQGQRFPVTVIILAFIFTAGLGYLGGVISGAKLLQNSGSLFSSDSLDLSTLQETYKALKSNYDGTIDTAKLIEGANKGLVNALGDDYTVYMNSTEASDFNNELSGNIGGGIGVELATRNDVPTIIRVLQNNPAEKAGLEVGDVITAVDGTSVKDLTLTKIVAKIRGTAGTTVKITVLRDGTTTKDFTITRATINDPSAYGEIVNGIGILTITRFDSDTGSLARTVAQNFKNKGVKGVILDLRGNGGGYVTAAQDVAGLWLDNKVVVTERAGGKVTDTITSGSNPVLNGIPTVVLVNKSSASASEIVSGALHDYKIATLVGETTYGKGSVQKLVDLSDGALLKVTVARWYTPNGVNISTKGITPDKVVDRTSADSNAGRDPQLDAAKALLK